MADDVVSVQVTADVGSYVEGMKAAATATVSSTTAARDSLGRFVSSANDATAAAQQMAAGVAGAAPAFTGVKTEVDAAAGAAASGGVAFESIGDKILQTGRRVRSEGRFASFIARDIQALIPTAGAAGNAVAGLVSGIAYGSGIAVAISAVRLLVAAFKDTDDGIKKLSQDSGETLDKMREQVADILASLNGETQGQNFGRKTIEPLEAARDQQKLLVDGAQRRVDIQRDMYMSQAAAGDTDDKALSDAEKRLEVETKTFNILVSQLRASKEAQGQIVGAEDNKGDSTTAAKLNAQRVQAVQETEVKVEEIRARGLDGNEKLEAEYVAKTEQMQLASADRIKQINAESENKGKQAALAADAAIAQERADLERKVTAELMAYRAELTRFSIEEGKKWAEQEQRWLDANIKAEQQASEAKKRLRADQDAYQLERGKLDSKVVDEALRRQIQAFREEAAVARQMGDAIGQVFAGIASGSMNAAKAFTNLASAGVKALFDIEIKTLEANAITAASTATRATGDVMANAAVASSGAAASQASIPFIGPALAIAAMAAMEAAVLGLLSLIPGAAVGADIPAGMNPFIQAHGSEIVLPRISSDVLRSLPEAVAAFQSGGAGGGDEFHFHFHFEAGTVVDQRTLDNHFQSGAVQQAISRAVRMGKWRG